MWVLQAHAGALPLWEIDGIANRVSLLGSIHLLKAGAPLPAAVTDAAHRADVIVLEVDLEHLDQLAAAEELAHLGTDADGRDLEQILGAPDFATAARKAGAAGLDIELVRPFQPWLAAIMLEQARLAASGFDQDNGVERQILRAADGRKEVRGLETMDEQLATLARLPRKAQRDFLMQTLDEARETDSATTAIVAAWSSGNTSVLERDFLAGVRQEPELYQRVIVNRNRNWAGQIAAMARDHRNYLVVVGTMHLVGPDSVLRMLAAAGLRSHQVNDSQPAAPERTRN